jgi:hypothetical protein
VFRGQALSLGAAEDVDTAREDLFESVAETTDEETVALLRQVHDAIEDDPEALADLIGDALNDGAVVLVAVMHVPACFRIVCEIAVRFGALVLALACLIIGECFAVHRCMVLTDALARRERPPARRTLVLALVSLPSLALLTHTTPHAPSEQYCQRKPNTPARRMFSPMNNTLSGANATDPAETIPNTLAQKRLNRASKRQVSPSSSMSAIYCIKLTAMSVTRTRASIIAAVNMAYPPVMTVSSETPTASRNKRPNPTAAPVSDNARAAPVR